MISQEQVDQIRELHAQGYSKQYIARKVGVSQPTTTVYIADSTRCGAGSKTKYEIIKSKLDNANLEALAEAFDAAHGNMALLSRMINDFPERFGLPNSFTVSDRAVRNFVHSNLPTPTKVVTPPSHFESVIGNQLQIDITHAEFQFAQDRKPRQILVFKAAYSWSHMPFLMVCPDMSKASWLRGIAACLFKYGVPKEILCDNDSGLVTSHPQNGKPIFTTEFSWFCKNLDITPRACMSEYTQTKGIVDRLGEHLKTHGLLWIQWGFKGKINTIEELNQALNYWIDNYDIKQRKFTEYIDGVKHTGTIQKLYDEERQHLWHIRPEAQSFVTFQNVRVDKRAQLTVHGYTITMAHYFAGADVMISIFANGNYIITNPASKIVYQGQIPYSKLCAYSFDNKTYDARTMEASTVIPA